MGLSRVFGLCAALFLASSPVSAAVTIDLGPSDYRNWGTGPASHTPNGIRSSFGQTVRMPPVGGSLTVTRNPIVPYGSIANAARNFVRINPASIAASAAMTALFLGLDWVFDEELDSWMKEGEDVYIDPNLALFEVRVGGVDYRAPTADLLCETALPHYSGGIYTFDRYVPSSPTFGYCWGTDQWGSSRSVFPIARISECPEGTEYNNNGFCVIDGALIPLNEGDWSEFSGYLPSADPDVVADAAGDAMKRQGAPLNGYSDTTITGPSSVSGPETTSTFTDPVTGDSVVTATQTTTNITYGDTTITTTNTTTTNTYTNGQHTGSETITETPGELPVTDGGGAPPAGEWPGFCEWASIVCDWIGWTQEEPPAEPDLPQVIDDDFYEEKTIQFGAKTCPPDYEISIPFLNTVVAVSMQPLCDFAGIIYYMVMAASYIIAAYITIGVARNG